MVDIILQTLMPFVVLSASLSATYTPSASMQLASTKPVYEVQYYTVKYGDTLTSISQDIYGSEDLWTLLWNDNDSVKSPETLEVGTRLIIRNGKVEFEELKDELKSRIPAVQVTPSAVVAQPVVNVSPTVQQPFVPTSGKILNDAQIAYLGQCESGMTATRNSGNGYYGAFQFSIPTWNSMNTGYARADLAPIEVQIDAVQRLLARSSIFTQFPGCARKMQANGLI